MNSGLRAILEKPEVYNFFQTIILANSARIKFYSRFIKGKNLNILDIGCGTGTLAKHLLSSNQDVNYYGFDLQKEYIDFCNKQYSSDNFYFFCEKIGDNLEADWKNKFDIVLAHGILHHLTDTESNLLLHAAENYLKKDGYLLTHDSLFYPGQSIIRKYFVSKDRGQNIRTPDDYLKLTRAYFNTVDHYILENEILLPYSSFVMKSSQPKVSSLMV